MTKKNPSSESKIDVKESWDVNFWCEELNLRAEELKEIVKKVGPEIHNVRVHLAKQLMVINPHARAY